MVDPDFDTFVPAVKGNQFEDFTVDQELTHHWGRTLTESDNVVFCAATCNWHPMYTNVEFARARGLSGTPLHPMLVLCTAVGLSVEDLSECGGPFLGIEDCTFRTPVCPGDTRTAHSQVLDKRTWESRPGVGIVTWHSEGRNPHGDVVVDFTRSNLVQSRSAL